jgi:Ca2+-binding RTX toxin-like protein
MRRRRLTNSSRLSNDVICTEPNGGVPGAPDAVDGGSGRDSIIGVGHLQGGSSDDIILVVGTGSVADGGSGNDLIEGENAGGSPSRLLGGSGGDTVLNFAGNPAIDCGSAYDLVAANGATDVRRCEGATRLPGLG